MSTEAAKMFLHSMVFSHLNYCLTNWSQANLSTLKPLESQYKQAIKILDKKKKLFHHCLILKKYQLLSREDLKKYFNVCLVFKVTHNLAPPPLAEYINRGTDRVTRGSLRVIVLFRCEKALLVSQPGPSKVQRNGIQPHNISGN